METNHIEAILVTAHNKAAHLAAAQVRQHLRPFNLKRHPLAIRNDSLALGGTRWWEFVSSRPVHQAIREAGEFVDNLPAAVVERLKDHL